MDLGLNGKVAVVTAASKGLGKATAEVLAEEGATLAICSREAERIDPVAVSLRERYGVEVLSLACDVTDPSSVEAFRDKVLEAFGTVHVLFTNAGGPPPGMVLEVTSRDHEKALRLNLLSAIDLIHAFLPSMRAQRWGRIIASTSITVKQPIPTLALSNVSRVGLVAFVTSLAAEVGDQNITANVVAPGYILTGRVRQLLEDRARKGQVPYEAAEQSIVQQIPAGRIGRPGEFGALVAFLASEQAGFINGETVLIDGGMYKGLF